MKIASAGYPNFVHQLSTFKFHESFYYSVNLYRKWYVHRASYCANRLALEK